MCEYLTRTIEEDIMERVIRLGLLTCILLMVGCAAFAQMRMTAPALKAQPGSKAEEHVTKGIERYNQGEWSEAQVLFLKALQADSKSAEAHYDLALTLDKAGDHLGAVQHFNSAAEFGTNNPEIQNSPILKAHLRRR
jgi:Flp pilus assembly protein TadD